MITLRDLQQEAKFGQKLDKLLQAGKITEAMKVADEHERLINVRQQFSLSEITKYMTEEHKEATNLCLRKICILSDIPTLAHVPHPLAQFLPCTAKPRIEIDNANKLVNVKFPYVYISHYPTS